MMALLRVLFVILALSALSCEAKVVGVVGISRHGTRAANPSLTQICPKNKANIEHYEKMGLSPGGLTGIGMSELRELGQFARERYVKDEELIPSHPSKLALIQAVEGERTLQSAYSFSQGLYPHGNVPVGYSPHETGPVAVYSVPSKIDDLLEARAASCKKKLNQDVKAWDDNKGDAVIHKNKGLVEKLGKLCGYDLLDESWPAIGDNIKDISDALTFDYYSGFPMLSGLTVNELNDVRKMAVEILFGRLYGSKEQDTYMSGSLPGAMLKDFEALVDGKNSKHVMWMYHGHREMLYAIQNYFQLTYDVPGVGVPKGAIPSATTLFFELHDGLGNNKKDHDHENKDKLAVKEESELKSQEVEIKKKEKGKENMFVRVVMWKPRDACAAEEHTPKGHCPPTILPMKGCSNVDCPFKEFQALIKKRQTENDGMDWFEMCVKGTDPASMKKKKDIAADLFRVGVFDDERFHYDDEENQILSDGLFGLSASFFELFIVFLSGMMASFAIYYFYLGGNKRQVINVNPTYEQIDI